MIMISESSYVYGHTFFLCSTNAQLLDGFEMAEGVSLTVDCS